MVLLFRKLRPPVTDDNANYISFESDCIVHPKLSFDSSGILHLITLFYFILQKLYLCKHLLIFQLLLHALFLLFFGDFIFKIFINTLFSQSIFRLKIKLWGRYRDFPYTSCSYALSAYLIIILHHIFIIDKPTLKYHSHSKFIVYIKIHFW